MGVEVVMRHRVLMVLFAIGTIAGYASGFRSMARCHGEKRQAFERHMGSDCGDARSSWLR